MSLPIDKDFYDNPKLWLNKVLEQIYHNMKINERLEKSLIRFFYSFEKYSAEEMLDILDGQLKIHANSQYSKNKSKITILEYLASEVLELSANQARNRKDKIIKVEDFIKAIVKDEELFPFINKYWSIKLVNDQNETIFKFGLGFLIDRDMYNKFLKIEGLNCLMIKNYTDDEIRRVFDYIEGDLDDELSEREEKLLFQLRN